MSTVILRNGCIYTPLDTGTPLRGIRQGEIVKISDGAILVKDGIISDIGREEQILKQLSSLHIDDEYDCEGRCVIPGFVDPHTHMCFAELREAEFEKRIGGVPYLDILAAGGGILSSVKAVAAASLEDLTANTMDRVRRALEFGSTTIEIKSGYGLDTANELKMLEAIKRAGQETEADVIPTFLGAHAVPQEYKGNADGFIDLVLG